MIYLDLTPSYFIAFLFAFLYGPFLFHYHPLNISEILKIQLPL